MRRARLASLFRVIVALLVLGTLVQRLHFVLFAHPVGKHVVSDMWVYDHRAQNLLAGTVGPWDTFTPPGYPALLALSYRITDGSKTFVGVVQACLSALLVWLVYRLGQRTLRRRWLSLLAALLTAVHLPYVLYAGLALTETTCAVLVTAAVLLVQPGRRRLLRLVAAGLLGGLAVTVRPNVLLFAPALVLVGALAGAGSWRDRTARAAALTAALAVLPAAAAHHNSRLLGVPASVATNGGLNFYLNFAEVARAEYREGARTHVIAPIPNILRFQATSVTTRPFYEDGHFYALGLQLLRERPARLLRGFDNLVELAGLGKQHYWPGWGPLERALAAHAKVFGAAVVVPALLVALVTLLRTRRTLPRAPSRWLGAAALVVCCVVAFFFLGDPRMRVPFDGLLLLLALVPVDAFLNHRARRRRRSSISSASTNPVVESSTNAS